MHLCYIDSVFCFVVVVVVVVLFPCISLSHIYIIKRLSQINVMLYCAWSSFLELGQAL